MDWSELLADCVDFARRLIQTPSMPGQEQKLAQLIAEEMRRQAFDEVWIDSIGNVSGRILGLNSDLGAIVLNSHMDHVDPGDLSLWPYPPYAAEIHEGRICGRGACDIKGPLAVQVYAMVALKRMGSQPRRDVVFTGVVEEEVGGTGASFWAENLTYDVDLIVLGEPSRNNLSLGHRGIFQLWVKFPGKSLHASVPDYATNPNLSLARFLTELEEQRHTLPEHELLGKTTVAPTIVEVDTRSMNVTPAWTRVLLDFRTASMSVNDIIAFVDRVAGDLPYSLSQAWTNEPDAPVIGSDEIIYGYYTQPEGEAIEQIVEAISRGMGRRPQLSGYHFATDGRYFTSLGATIVGYSPGEEDLAHTVDESISIEMMAGSLRGYVELLRTF